MPKPVSWYVSIKVTTHNSSSVANHICIWYLSDKFLSQRKRTVTFACYYERTNGDSQLARGKHNKIIRTDISSLMRLQRASLILAKKKGISYIVQNPTMQHQKFNMRNAAWIKEYGIFSLKTILLQVTAWGNLQWRFEMHIYSDWP